MAKQRQHLVIKETTYGDGSAELFSVAVELTSLGLTVKGMLSGGYSEALLTYEMEDSSGTRFNLVLTGEGSQIALECDTDRETLHRLIRLADNLLKIGDKSK